MVQEDELDSDTDSGNETGINKQLFKDLENIKLKKAQQVEIFNQQLVNSYKSEISTGEVGELSKRDEKELKKLMKEKDKLERDAMVARMLDKDKEQAARNKIGGVVETNAQNQLTLIDKAKYIPELRKVSRQKYLELREEQQLDLFKRRLEDEIKIFGD